MNTRHQPQPPYSRPPRPPQPYGDYPYFPQRQYQPPAGYATPLPPPNEKHTVRNVLLGLAGAFVLILVLASLARPATSTSTATSGSPGLPAAPAAPGPSPG